MIRQSHKKAFAHNRDEEDDGGDDDYDEEYDEDVSSDQDRECDMEGMDDRGIDESEGEIEHEEDIWMQEAGEGDMDVDRGGRVT